MIDHVSDLQWDRLLAGELDAVAGNAARGHARSCLLCASRLRDLTVERDGFQVRPRTFSLEPAVRRRWSFALVPVLAAAALLVIVRGRSELDGDRPKGGGPVLLLETGRPGALVAVASGDAIHPGEYLQAGYSAARDGFGAVLARDGAGAVMAYVPAHGDTMVALPAGVERSFPQSTILDNVVGGERIVLVWCEAAQPLAPMLAELRAGQAIAPPAGCAIRELVLDKRAEPR